MTLTGVAQSIGISKSTLSRLETGQRRPTLELLLALSQTYRVPLDDLGAHSRCASALWRDLDHVAGVSSTSNRAAHPILARSSAAADSLEEVCQG
jgi:transcriptional regulator with XRE-family HTH domain